MKSTLVGESDSLFINNNKVTIYSNSRYWNRGFIPSLCEIALLILKQSKLSLIFIHSNQKVQKLHSQRGLQDVGLSLKCENIYRQVHMLIYLLYQLCLSYESFRNQQISVLVQVCIEIQIFFKKLFICLYCSQIFLQASAGVLLILTKAGSSTEISLYVLCLMENY